MKRIIYFLAIVLCSLAWTNCSDDVDDVFGQEPSERMELTLEQIRSTLASSSSGWAMDYYLPNANAAVNILFRFREDGTTDIGRMVTVRENPDDDGVVVFDQQESSTYQVLSNMGPIITFDTYNRLLHYYAEPGKNGIGFKGDYEFIVLDITADKLTLRGKKHGVTMTMWRMEEGRIWKDYLSDAYDMMDIVNARIQTEWRKKMVTYGGKSEVVYHNALRGLKFPEEMNESGGFIDYTVTDKGIRLLSPVVYEGKEIYDFIPNAEATEFKAPNADMKITRGVLNLNEQLNFNGLWGIKDMCPLYQDDWMAAINAVPGGAALAVSLSTRRDSETQPVLAIHYLQGGLFLTSGKFYYEFTPVEGTTDQVTLRYRNLYDADAGYILNYATNQAAIPKLFSIFGSTGSEAVTFRLSVEEGTEELPTRMKFVNIKDNGHYFSGYYMRLINPRT